MFFNPILNALFDKEASMPSPRLGDIRQRFNERKTFIIVLPPTKLLLDIDLTVLYQDAYLLAHIAEIDLEKKKLQPSFTANTIMPGHCLQFSENYVRTLKGFASDRKIAITQAKLWNPGLSYISLDQAFILVETNDLLLLPDNVKKPSIFRRDRSTSNASQTSLGPLSPFSHSFSPSAEPEKTENVEWFANNKQKTLKSFLDQQIDGYISGRSNRTALAEDFRNLLREATENSANLGSDGSRAVYSYLERHLRPIILERLNQVNSLAPSFTDLKRGLRALDIGQVGLPDGINFQLCEQQIYHAAEQIDTLAEARCAKEMGIVFVSVLETLCDPVLGNVSADMLLGLILLSLIRSNASDSIDNFLFYVGHFSYEPVAGGRLGYALLTFESVLLHMRSDYRRLARLSAANEAFWEAVSSSSSLLEVDSSANLPGVVSSRKQGESALFLAIKKHNPVILKQLLSFKQFSSEFILHDRNGQGQTLLFAAVRTGIRELIEPLLDHIRKRSTRDQRCYLNMRDKNFRNLGHVIFHYPEIIYKVGDLLDWAAKDAFGSTPITILACCYDLPEHETFMMKAIELWLKNSNKASFYEHIDSKGNTLLHVINPSSARVLELLYGVPGFDVNWLNNKGQVALMVAAKFERLILAKYLLQKGAFTFLLDKNNLSILQLAKGASVALVEAANGRVNSETVSPIMLEHKVYYELKHGKRVRHASKDFLEFREMLQRMFPQSWVPPVWVPESHITDPWKLYRSSAFSASFQLDCFLRLLQVHPSIKNSDEYQKFCDDEKWQDLSRGTNRIAVKFSSEDRSTGIQYSDSEVNSIATFFLFSIEQIQALMEHFTRMSIAYKRLAVASVEECASRNFLFETILEKDNSYQCVSPIYRQTLLLEVKVYETLNGSFGILARYSLSFMKTLERPLEMLDFYKTIETELQGYHDRMKRLSESRPWLSSIFEDRRAREIHEIETSISSGQTQLLNLAKHINESHYTLASELSAFHSFQENEILKSIMDFAAKRIKLERVISQRLDFVLHTIKELS